MIISINLLSGNAIKSISLGFRACKNQPTLPSKIRSNSTTKLKTASNFQYSIAVKILFYQMFAKENRKTRNAFAKEKILQLEVMELVNVEGIYLR